MIVQLRQHVSWLLRKQFVRFLLVGGVNTVFGYGCFLAFMQTGLSYGIALLFANILGVLFNFKTFGNLVFRANSPLLWRFVLVYVFTYSVNMAGIALLKYLGMNVYWASAMLVLPIAVLAFALNRKFVFHARDVAAL